MKDEEMEESNQAQEVVNEGDPEKHVLRVWQILYCAESICRIGTACGDVIR